MHTGYARAELGQHTEQCSSIHNCFFGLECLGNSLPITEYVVIQGKSGLGTCLISLERARNLFTINVQYADMSDKGVGVGNRSQTPLKDMGPLQGKAPRRIWQLGPDILSWPVYEREQ